MAHHELRCDRNACARELLRSDRSSNLLTVDQHAVAIKDDHGSLAPARSLRGRAGPAQRITTRAIGIAAVAKVGRDASRRLFAQFLGLAANARGKRTNLAWL